MRTPDILNRFLKEDCGAANRSRLLDLIEQGLMERDGVIREFNTNRFNIYLNFRDGEVTVEDDLDTSAAGSRSLSLDEFAAALAKLTFPGRG